MVNSLIHHNFNILRKYFFRSCMCNSTKIYHRFSKAKIHKELLLRTILKWPKINSTLTFSSLGRKTVDLLRDMSPLTGWGDPTPLPLQKSTSFKQKV